MLHLQLCTALYFMGTIIAILEYFTNLLIRESRH